jgi:uncharacterized protein (TIGR02118 family)
MTVMLIALRRRRDLGREAFLAHWLETHAPLVRALAGDLGIRSYTQFHMEPGSGPWDGLARVGFASRADLERHLATPAGRAAARALRADERTFVDIDQTATWWASDHVVL